MAKIEKMKISGIRSYSPESGCVIEFPSPLTLIVGQNGCGKTSIIECLSYIMTGNLPPGCKTASSFIHDPKFAGEKEVKGQVKLQFRDITGNRIVCTRSATSTQKARTLQAKSLEGTIEKISSTTGQKTSLSSRCTDFTKEMISRLGVSKAVLENVIFCHQEDSYWPLSEGKALKQKFDAIFAATRYIKALESIRNIRKEQDNEVKVYGADLKHLTDIKDKSAEIKKELAKANAQVAVCNDDMIKITNISKPVEQELEELNKVLSEIIEIQRKMAEMGSSKKELEKTIKELDQNIEKRFEGTLEELKFEQGKYESELNRKTDEMTDMKTIIRRLGIELDTLGEKKTKLIQEQGRLQQEAKTNKSLIQERNAQINVLAREFHLSEFLSEEYTDEEAADFIQEMKRIYGATVNEGKRARDQYNDKIEEVESTIKKHEKSLHGYENTMEQKRKIIDSNTTKLSELSRELNSLAASENKLQMQSKQLKKKESTLKQFRSEINLEVLEEEIKTLSAEKKREENELGDLKHDENILLQQSEGQTKISMMEKEKADKKDTFDNILRKHQEKLHSVFETRPPVDELKSELSNVLRRCQSKIKVHGDDILKSQKKLANIESKRNMLLEEQGSKETELSRCKKKIHDACAENNYNEYREQVQQKVESFTNALMEISAFEKIYKKYIKQLQQNEDDGCPLCHRNFNSKREIRNLLEELKEKINTLPDKKDSTEHILQEEKKLQKELQDLAPSQNRILLLAEEIPKLQAQILVLNGEIQDEKQRFEKLQSSRVAVEETEKLSRSMEADISRIDEYLFDLKDLDREITLEKGKIKGVSDGRTLQSVRNEVQEKDELVSNLSRKIDQKRDKFMEHQKTLGSLEREVNDINSELLSLKSELQKRTQMEHQKAELTSTNQSYEREIKEAANQLQPIKDTLSKEKEKRGELKRSSELKASEITDKLTKIKTQGDKIRDKDEKIKRYQDEGRENALGDNTRQLKTLESTTNIKTDEIDKVKNKVKRINDEVSRQQIRVRELDDNVKLMEKEKEIRLIKAKMEDLKKNLSDYDNYQDFEQKRTRLQDKLDGYRNKRAEIQGRIKGFEDEIKRCERDLRSALYADADLKHCQKVIEMKTTELANQDLHKYYKALDSAIMRYHGLKLADINKIIKEYWVKTYRGNDIDTIEIVAEKDEEGSGASRSRQSYNYRVSMVKGGTSLDMRGRCSAGQKVLASIIIRLALAETFCLNCGILALDEPTTNLDEENVTSLAQSLRDIIEHRRQQNNFQLLVITHDEDFVQALGRTDYVEHYFKIYKDDKQHSRIQRVPFRE